MINKNMIIRIGCLIIFATLISINFVNADPADVTINHKDEIKVNTPLRITVQVTMDGSPVENANVLLYVVNPYGESDPLTDYTDQNGKAVFKYTGADVIAKEKVDV